MLLPSLENELIFTRTGQAKRLNSQNRGNASELKRDILRTVVRK